MKVLKLISKILVSPFILAVGIVYVLGNVLTAVSSIVTYLVGTFFIFGAVCGWITHAKEGLVWQAAITGAIILFLPLIVKGPLELVLHLSGPLMKIMAWR